MDSQLSLQITADLKELERMRRFIEEQAAALGAEPSAIYDLLLSVNEMVTNIIVHGYRGRPGTISIELQPAGNALVVRLRDQASQFDPTRVPAPDLTQPLHKRPPGGMGIHLTRRFVDSMSHRVTDEGGNELTLIKQGIIDPRR
jgi:serine/threonine-protein kinase RsbW